MTLALDISEDFADVIEGDGDEAVTVNRRGKTNTAVANALRRTINTREIVASDGQYQHNDVRWHLPVEECATAPAMGDALVDTDGNYWTILAVTKATLSSRWLCICRDVAVANGLDDTIVIEKTTITADTGGAAADDWHPWRTGVRAKIQPFDSDVTVGAGAHRTVRRYRIYIAEDLELSHVHRIRDMEGTYYRIERYDAAEDVGQLQTIEVTKWRSS